MIFDILKKKQQTKTFLARERLPFGRLAQLLELAKLQPAFDKQIN